MQVIAKGQGISVQKPEGTNVTYYIFPEYEIHYNEVLPHTTQQWHHHVHVEEVLFIISGNIEAHWLEGGQKRSRTLHPGDVVRVEHTPHTFRNNTDELVIFLVIRLVLDGSDKRELIKADKQLDYLD